jgi:hypothetical protein
LIDDAVDAILVNDESKRKYMSLAESDSNRGLP